MTGLLVFVAALVCLMVADVVAFGAVMNRYLKQRAPRIAALSEWLDSTDRAIAWLPLGSLYSLAFRKPPPTHQRGREVMGAVYIHAPRATAKRVHAETCLDCKRRTRMVEFFTPWYGWDATCLRCGRNWKDTEWMPLPFMRGARQQNIDRARSYWRRMPPVSANHYGIEPTSEGGRDE